MWWDMVYLGEVIVMNVYLYFKGVVVLIIVISLFMFVVV